MRMKSLSTNIGRLLLYFLILAFILQPTLTLAAPPLPLPAQGNQPIPEQQKKQGSNQGIPDNKALPIPQDSQAEPAQKSNPIPQQDDPAPAPEPDEQQEAPEPNVPADNEGQHEALAPGNENVELPFDGPKKAGVSALRVTPSDQTGALSYDIPIVIPPGRNGMQPSLSLVYNSQQDDNESIVGYGWSLSVPYIERIARKGVNRLYDEHFFYSSLSGEIVAIDINEDGFGVYGPKVDTGSFLSYELRDDHSWLVRDKQGRSYTFGKTLQSRLHDPDDNSRVYAYFLEEMRDTNDNFVAYEYAREDNQLYPERVRYTGHADEHGIFSIHFSREARNDEVVSYKRDFSVETTERINRIEARINGEWVRRYDLSYISGENGRRSLLQSVTESGRREDNGQVTTLPATSFSYQEKSGDWRFLVEFPRLIAWDQPQRFVDGVNSGYKPVDVNGDGVVDLIRALQGNFINDINNGGTFLSKIDNDGNISWESHHDSDQNSKYIAPRPITTGHKSDLGVRFADVNGDGYVDFIQAWQDADTGQSHKGVYINNKRDGWDEDENYVIPQNFIIYDSNRRRITDNGVRITDVNGDGLSDFVEAWGDDWWGDNARARKRVFVNKGDGTGWELDENFSVRNGFMVNGFTSGQLDKGVRIADVNGDGLPDLVRVHTDRSPSKVAINTGTGWFEVDSYNSFPPRTTPADGAKHGFNKDMILTDVNGDGLADIVRARKHNLVEKQYRAVYINKGDGTGWELSDDYALPPGAGLIDMDEDGEDTGTRYFDMDGDGMADVIPNDRIFTNENAKPDLLKRIDHSSGASTQIAYKPTTAYHAGANRLNDRLPIVLQTVHEIVQDDGLGNIATTRHEYHDGLYFYNNAFDRRFSGFAKVRNTNALGDITDKYFHQGDDTSVQLGEFLDSAAKISMVYREDIMNAEDVVYKRTKNTWHTEDLGNERNFVYVADSLEQFYDGNNDHKDRAVSFSYDPSNGNLLSKTEWGEVIGNDDVGFNDLGNDTRVTTYEYAHADNSHVRSAPSLYTLTDGNANRVSQAKYYYDDLPHGEIGSGNQTAKEIWIANDRFSRSESAYTDTGLVRLSRDARQNETTYVYDQHNLYPETVTNARDHVTRFAYDYSLGKPSRITDPNGAVSETVYDGIDREIEKRGSDPLVDGLEVLLQAVTYTDDQMPRIRVVTNYLNDNNGVQTYHYSDGLDRTIQTRVEGREGSYVVKDYVYDLNSQLARESLPYHSQGPDRTDPQQNNDLLVSYTYDPMGRLSSMTNAAGTNRHIHDDWIVTIEDANENTKELHHDAFEQLVGVVERNGGEEYLTEYAYNEMGVLTSITDAQGNVRGFSYDGRGLRTRAEDMHDPEDDSYGVQVFVFDDVGNLTQTTDPKNQIIRYSYDALNRIETEDYLGADGIEITYTYDECLEGVTKLCQVHKGANDTIITEYAYDFAGNTKVGRVDVLGEVFTTEYAFDRAGNTRTIIYPDQSVTSYSYGTDGKVRAVSHDNEQIISLVTYHPNGLPERVEYANGVVQVNEYDENEVYRLRNKHTQNQAGTVLQDITYTYDNVGNIIELDDSSDTSAAKRAVYTYDDLYRLTRAEITNTANDEDYVRSYTYSPIGNMLTKSDQGEYVYTGNEDGSFANPHAVTGINNRRFVYDQNGNMTDNGSGLTLTWDYRNRLTRTEVPPQIIGNVYEDAEDGRSDSWGIYGVREAREQATVQNVLDPQRGRVITFDYPNGNRTYPWAAISYVPEDGGQWIDERDYRTLMFDIKRDGRVSFKVGVYTEVGYRSLEYSPRYQNARASDSRVTINIDNELGDGNWHTIVRDLQADLEIGFPDETIEQIASFSLFRPLSLDNLMFVEENPLGSVFGTIVDEAGDPAQRAQITLLETGQSMRTDESGRYRFASLRPGQYSVEVMLNDCELAVNPASVMIGAGEAVEHNFACQLPTATVYEDAEDGSTERWMIFRNAATSEINNILDEERNSRVIELVSRLGRRGGFWLRANQELENWNNDRQRVISWDMKKSGTYYIMVQLSTDRGNRYILYNSRFSNQRRRSYDFINIGVVEDDRWYSFERDLQEDLNSLEPDNNIREVKSLIFFGSASFDNIQLKDERS